MAGGRRPRRALGDGHDMSRQAVLDQIIARRRPFDLIVIGGGATGAGIAWDGAGRGLSTVLLEGTDFGQGTSSRSTKLIHGGIRYLAQGQLGLVREALRERRLLLANAPEHVRPLRFLIPTSNFCETLKYRAGLALYATLAGERHPLADTGAEPAVCAAVRPWLQAAPHRLLSYQDAQFDDARLLFAVLGRAVTLGATVLNYARVVALNQQQDGHLAGVAFQDQLSGRTYEIEGTLIINAAGPGVAAVAALGGARLNPPITLSRGSHVVVKRAFWPRPEALLMPHTPDGRIMFAIPWQDHLLLGTTDVPTVSTADPRASEEEIAQILAVAGRYLAHPPQLTDVQACFAGVRPLAGVAASHTAGLSREYQLSVDDSGLISSYGGKWTTFRRMAEHAITTALRAHRLHARPSRTAHDYLPAQTSLIPPTLRPPAPLPSTPEDDTPLVPGFTYSVRAARLGIQEEMAVSIEDLLARRSRCLFLNAGAAREAAPAVARLLSRELGHDEAWQTEALNTFEQVAAAFQPASQGVRT